MNDPLLERLNAAYRELTSLEQERPGTAAEFAGLISKLTSIAELAYGRAIQLVKPMREHTKLPSKEIQEQLRKEIRSAYDRKWIHEIARISDSLGALRVAYNARLIDLQHIHSGRSLDGLFNALGRGEHSFENSIRETVVGVENSIGGAATDADWDEAVRRADNLIAGVGTALRKLRTASEVIMKSVVSRDAAAPPSRAKRPRALPEEAGDGQHKNGENMHTDVMVVTVNEHETRALIDVSERMTGRMAKVVPIQGRTYRDLGVVNGWRVVHALSEMGGSGRGSAHETVDLGIRALNPKAVVAVGIAFGVSEEKQAIGDVLVSRHLRLYEAQRVGANIILRGDRPHASPWLVNLFEGVAQTTWTGQPVRFGLVLSGEKLVDDIDWRDQLRKFEEEAIGGEMEGAGLYVASEGHKKDWIVVKAIADWADGNKAKDKIHRQKLAALNAANFFFFTLQQVPPTVMKGYV